MTFLSTGVDVAVVTAAVTGTLQPAVMAKAHKVSKEKMVAGTCA